MSLCGQGFPSLQLRWESSHSPHSTLVWMPILKARWSPSHQQLTSSPSLNSFRVLPISGQQFQVPGLSSQHSSRASHAREGALSPPPSAVLPFPPHCLSLQRSSAPFVWRFPGSERGSSISRRLGSIPGTVSSQEQAAAKAPSSSRNPGGAHVASAHCREPAKHHNCCPPASSAGSIPGPNRSPRRGDGNVPTGS